MPKKNLTSSRNQKGNDPLFPTYNRSPYVFERGEGSYLMTSDGTRFLDCSAGVAVNSLGHGHPRLLKALTEQAEKLWHVSNLHPVPAQQELAALLTGNSFADMVFFANSGAEAVEACLKTARKYHAARGAEKRYRFITFSGSFHGRTLATIAAAGNPAYLDGFGPPLEGFDQLAVDDLEGVEKAVTGETAGILIEPVQGEGGIHVVPAPTLQKLRQICDEHGILLILDEVQTGMGRTGKLFAHEWAGIEPDLLAAAKGLGGGFPIGACLATREAGQFMTAGTHGSTFGGNPLAAAVSREVTTILLEEGFLEEVEHKGLVLRQKLARLKDENSDLIEDIRGIGLMQGLKFSVPVGEIVTALQEEQMLAVPAGDNVLRLLPPLNISSEDLALACEKISAACQRYRKKHSGLHRSGICEDT